MPMTGSATVGSGPNGEFKIDVKASTDFEYDYTFVDTTPSSKGCFDVNLPYMADRFREYGRCVVVCDARVYDIYGESMRTYFQHHGMGTLKTSQMHGNNPKYHEVSSTIAKIDGQSCMKFKATVFAPDLTCLQLLSYYSSNIR